MVLVFWFGTHREHFVSHHITFGRANEPVGAYQQQKRTAGPARLSASLPDQVQFGATTQSQPIVEKPSFWRTVNRKAFGEDWQAWARVLVGVALYPFTLAAAACMWPGQGTGWFKPVSSPVPALETERREPSDRSDASEDAQSGRPLSAAEAPAPDGEHSEPKANEIGSGAHEPTPQYFGEEESEEGPEYDGFSSVSGQEPVQSGGPANNEEGPEYGGFASVSGDDTHTLLLGIPSPAHAAGSSTSGDQTVTLRTPSVLPLAEQKRLMEIFRIPYPFNIYNQTGTSGVLQPTEAMTRLRTAKTVALGDLHGSYRKLLDNLLTAGMISMPKDKAQEFMTLSEDLEKLLQKKDPGAYLTGYEPSPDSDPQTRARLLQEKANVVAQIQPIYERLAALIPSIQWTGGDRRLILIGDVLSDRGPLDTVTLDIIDQLTQDHPERMTRIASNHDHVVLRYLLTKNDDGHRMRRYDTQYSLQRAYALAEATGTLPQLYAKYERYLSQSNLMHYTPQDKTLYVHAPVTIDDYKNLVKDLGAESALPPGSSGIYRYGQINGQNLPQLINGLNSAYQRFVHNAFQTGQVPKGVDDAFERFVFDPRTTLEEPSLLLFKDKGVETMVHGHHPKTGPFEMTQGGYQRKPGQYGVANLDQNVDKIGRIGADELLTNNVNKVFVTE